MNYAKANAEPMTGYGALVIINTRQKLPWRPSSGRVYNQPLLRFNNIGDKISVKYFKFNLNAMAVARGMTGVKKIKWINHFKKLKEIKCI